MIYVRFILLIISSLILFTSCNSSISNQNSSNQTGVINTQKNEKIINITVSILPQKYFVEKIGGDRVKINVMVKPGASYHTYEPLPQQLREISQAQAYITIGDAFENAWLDKIKSANPKMLIVDSTKGINKIEISDHDHHNEEEKHDDNDSEKNLDPHVWLSPQLVKIQAQNIYQILSQLDPENQEEYQTNLDKFITEIEQLDQQIKNNLAEIKNRKFMVFHPSWGYFAREYNLEQIPIEVGGQEPSASELANLISLAKQENIKVIFAQPEFSDKSAKTIAQEINGKVLLISPLAENWADNLLKISEVFADSL
jgi:zinc transport system substrate-binding protein